MKPPAAFEKDPISPRLFRRSSDEHPSLWTAALGNPPSVYGEPTRAEGAWTLRRWDPSRSKLAAGIVRGFEGPVPGVGERWLYLGAAAGTTVSHVADLVGPEGAVVAVEPSPRSFVRLLATARRYPNLWPVLADARHPEEYAGLVPPLDGMYVDVAQPDQVEIALQNAAWFLRAGGALILALKTSSMGRDVGPEEHLARAQRALGTRFALAPSVRLDPVHRRHFLIGTRGGRDLSERRGRPSRRLTQRPRDHRGARRR